MANMKVSLEGLIENSIRAIAPGSQDFYGFPLREMYGHLCEVAHDPTRWAEFAQMYGLPKPKKLTLADGVLKEKKP